MTIEFKIITVGLDVFKVLLVRQIFICFGEKDFGVLQSSLKHPVCLLLKPLQVIEWSFLISIESFH